jgi:hypothetical protein
MERVLAGNHHRHGKKGCGLTNRTRVFFASRTGVLVPAIDDGSKADITSARLARKEISGV